MKHLKLFEEVHILPKVGDWCVATFSYNLSDGKGPQEKEIYGEVVEIGGVIIQDMITIFDGNIKKLVHLSKLKYWSKNKEDLDVYIQANKYNM